MRYVEYYLNLIKLHNRPWSDMEKGVFAILLAFTIVMSLAGIFRKKLHVMQAVAIVGFIVCVCFLYATTLFTRRPMGVRQFRCLLTVDWRLFRAGVQSEIDQITLNIILFLPFGILWDIIRKNRSSIFEIICIGAALSLSVEIMQYFSTRGVLDIEDLLTNIMGMFIGGVLIKIFYLLYQIREKLIKKQN